MFEISAGPTKPPMTAKVSKSPATSRHTASALMPRPGMALYGRTASSTTCRPLIPPRSFRSATTDSHTRVWSPQPLGEKPLSTSQSKSMVVAAMWIESSVTPRQEAVSGSWTGSIGLTWKAPAGEYS